MKIAGWRIEHFGKACPYCGEAMNETHKPTRDHIQPKSRGGSDAPSNLLIVCEPCNQDKGCLTIGEWFGVILRDGDPRADYVGKLTAAAWDENPALGVDISADAGIGFALRYRNRTLNAQEIETHFARMRREQAARLPIERICIKAAATLKIDLASWSIDRHLRFVTLIGGRSHAFRVTTAEELVDRVRIEMLRVERERIDCRPRRFMPNLSEAAAA